MNVHKILVGEGASQHLPFALSKLRSLKLLGRQATIQKFAIGDATIRIEYNPNTEQHFIRIDSGGGTLGYEFFSTEDYITAFPVAWWATAVVPRKKAGQWKLSASKLSTAFTDGPVPVVPRDPLGPAVNGQRNAQYHWWPAAEGVKATDAVRTKPCFMTSSYGCYTWQAPDMDRENFMGSYSTVDGVTPSPHDFLFDIGVDLAPALYENGRAKLGLPFPILPNWPRRAAFMEVDGRRFVIMSDMQSNFHAFPEAYLTSDMVQHGIPEALDVIVPHGDYMPAGVALPTMAGMYVAPRGSITEYGSRWSVVPSDPAPIIAPYSSYPDSMLEPDADEAKQYQRHHYLWDFHPTGTRAVAVVHVNQRDELRFGTGLGGEGTAYCLTEYGPQNMIRDTSVNLPWVEAAGGATTVSMSERAVLEVEFDIQITGERPQDFTFSVTTRRLITGGWYFDAQYAYCDTRLEALGVFGGDLLTDEIRLRGTHPTSSDLWVHDEFVVARNQDRATDVQAICVAQNRPYSMYQAFRGVERVRLSTYPGEPPLIWRFFMSERQPEGAYGIARMLSSDLRSLSKVFEQSRDGESVGLHVIAFGEGRQGSPLPRTEEAAQAAGLVAIPPTFIPSGSPWISGQDVAPNSLLAAHALGLHRLAWDHITYRYGFDTSVHTGISTHPDGHFAVFACFKNPFTPSAPVIPFDIIEYRRVELNEAGDPVEVFDRTTHIEAFEAAFGVEFDLPAFIAAINSDKPRVVQRFSSWRNIKLPKLPGSKGYFSVNPKLGDPG